MRSSHHIPVKVLPTKDVEGVAVLMSLVVLLVVVMVLLLLLVIIFEAAVVVVVVVVVEGQRGLGMKNPSEQQELVTMTTMAARPAATFMADNLG